MKNWEVIKTKLLKASSNFYLSSNSFTTNKCSFTSKWLNSLLSNTKPPRWFCSSNWWVKVWIQMQIRAMVSFSKDSSSMDKQQGSILFNQAFILSFQVSQELLVCCPDNIHNFQGFQDKMEQLQVLKIKTLTFNSSLCQWCPWCILSNHCCHRMDWTLHTDSSQLKIQIRTNLISEMFWMNEFEI